MRFSDYARRRKFGHYPYANEDADHLVGVISLIVVLWFVVAPLIERVVQ